MRVLQINVSANSGSTGRIVRDIGKLVLANGGESFVAFGRKSQPIDSVLLRVGRYFDVWMHGMETRIFDNHGLSSRHATHIFIEKIKEIKPDIVHLHNIHGYYINYRILFKYLSDNKIPVVWTLHDCWSFTGHCAHFVTAGCEKWRSGCFDCPLKMSYPKSVLLDASSRNYKLKKDIFNSIDNLTLVPVSGWLHNLLKDSFLGNKRMRVIRNGIDLNTFKPAVCKKDELGLDPNKYTVLGVASKWTKEKGLDEFVQLSQNSRYQVVMIGVDDVIRKKLPPEIVAIARTESQEVLAKYYSVADVFLNPTYADTYPTVNLEALACGTPVVTYETGGSPETLDENTGVVVEKGNVDALLAAVDKLVGEDEQSTISRRNECRKRTLEHFDCYMRFADYINLYREILNK